MGDLAVVNGQLDGPALARMIRDSGVVLAVVEQVGAMPKQGIASTFKFGVACGLIRGVLSALTVPIHYVAPAVWKRHFRLLGTDKEAARALAINLHPAVLGMDLKRHHGRADALLMLDWYLADRGVAPAIKLWPASLNATDETD